ncbi:hypothetical protein CK203_073397 [Vitis vinifera]|uniref:Integrase zinc-binding domain-containing protein n=1 Tax=Vitis vinifera TaxID=29760 RepID=A0A438ESM5_VITVI|nr:hypothetical protein CK203_073397 [Vitis vinifera]
MKQILDCSFHRLGDVGQIMSRVANGGLKRKLLRETHDAKWEGHSGEERTLALLARSYYWSKMGEDVQAYVKSYLVFQMDKIEKKKVELFKLLGSELKFSTANHPQTNEQTERINALLEEYLKHYSKMFLEVARQKAGGNSLVAYKLAQEMLDEALDFLEKATRQMKKYVDRDQRPLKFQVAYMLKLLERLKHHPTFHVNFLKSYHGDLDGERVQTKRTPPLVMKQFDQEKGTSKVEATWENDVTLWQFEEAVWMYWQTKLTRASTSVGAQCPMHQEGTAIGVMSWLVDVEP